MGVNLGCAEEHEQITGDLQRIERSLESHINEVHTNLVREGQLVETDTRIEEKLDAFQSESKADRIEIHRQLDEMAEVVLGEKHVEFDGNVTRSGGMKAMVEANENGGLRFKYMNLIVGALVSVILGLIGLAGIIYQHGQDTQQVVDQVLEEVQVQLQDIIELELQESR